MIDVVLICCQGQTNGPNIATIRPTDVCHYLVMSTHKWLGNVKTAGLVVYAEGVAPPMPHAVSFGYDKGRSESQPNRIAS